MSFRLTLCLIAMLMLVCTPAASRASGIGAVRTLPVCISAVQPGDTPASPVERRAACGTDQTRLGPGDFWAVSEPLNDRISIENPMRVRIASVWQNRIALTAIYADGRQVTQALNNRGISQHIQLGALIEWELPHHTAPLRRLVWRVDDSANLRGVLLGAHILNHRSVDYHNLRMAAIYAGFVGLALALIIYNLAMWAALRHRFQAQYCIMVALLIGYMVSSSGLLAWVIPDLANNDRLRINHFFLATSAAAALAFANRYFEPRITAGWVGRLQAVVMGALVTAGIGFAPLSMLSIGLADRLYSLIFAGLMLQASVLTRACWHRRSDYRLMFSVAWGLPVLSGLARTAANLGLIPWNFWLDNSTIIAMSAEALLSSLAIAYRIHLLGRERDAALAGAVAAQLLADTDPLTGLLNRRSFLSRAIGRTGDQQLMIIDIDHFKRVNDTLGHDGGDEVLRIFARVLREVASPGALAARIGGEEFALVQDAARAIRPDTILDRLRTARMPFDLTVTASIGCSVGPLSDERDWKRLYRSTDRALFDAKAAGRDRVRDARSSAAA